MPWSIPRVGTAHLHGWEMCKYFCPLAYFKILHIICHGSRGSTGCGLAPVGCCWPPFDTAYPTTAAPGGRCLVGGAWWAVPGGRCYDDEEIEPGFIYAVKAYPMNVNITPAVMDDLIRLVLAARDAIEAGVKPQPNDDAGNCPLPYSDFSNITPLECASDEAGAGGATSDNLLSGIGRQSRKALKRLKKRRKKGS